MKRRLIIIGASGHGKVVADIAVKMNHWSNISFLDDNPNVAECMGFNVIGKVSDAIKFGKDADFFVAIGDNQTRETIHNELDLSELHIINLVHPQAVIGENVTIGKGTAIMAGVVINSSVRIGKGCIINTASCIDHDNTIGNFVHISPGTSIAGSVAIGDRSWLGIGSVIVNDLTIGPNCIVGAGAVVIRDIKSDITVVGNPAKPINISK